MCLFLRVSALIKVMLLFALFTGMVIAFSGGPPLERTGGFGESTCVVCHNSFPLNSPGGSVTMEGLPTNGYTPGTDYPITVRVTRSGQSRWGFELAARVQANGAQAGNLTAGSGTQVRTSSTNNVQYISHTAPGTQAGQMDSGSWTFTWRSPATGTGPVQFNVAGNAANNNGLPTGDYIFTSQAVVNEGVAPPSCSLPNNTYFAQFANGTGFVSKLLLTNPGAAPVDVCLDVRSDGGGPLTFNMSSEPSGISPVGTFSIPPGGGVIFTTDGQGDLRSGSLRVGSSAAIGGVVIFSASGIGITGVGASGLLSGFITPVERNTSPLNTGIALVNPSDNPVTVNLSLRRLDGSEAAAGTVNLPPHGHTAAFIDATFGDSVTNNFRGNVVGRTASGNVAVTAVRLGSEFTTLPVTPLP